MLLSPDNRALVDSLDATLPGDWIIVFRISDASTSGMYSIFSNAYTSKKPIAFVP